MYGRSPPNFSIGPVWLLMNGHQLLSVRAAKCLLLRGRVTMVLTAAEMKVVVVGGSRFGIQELCLSRAYWICGKVAVEEQIVDCFMNH